MADALGPVPGTVALEELWVDVVQRLRDPSTQAEFWKTGTLRLIRETIDDDPVLLTEVLVESRFIRNLQLIACSFSENNFISLARNLNRCNLVSLTARSMQLTGEAAGALAAAAMESQLKEIDMSHNTVGSKGLSYIGHALLDSGIESVTLTNNNIDSTGVEELGRAISRGGCALKYLDIGRNNIGASLSALTDGLRHTNIEVCRFDYIMPTKAAVYDFLDFLSESRSVSKVHLGINLIGDDAMERFSAMLTKNTSLVHLALYGNPITDDGVEILAQGVKMSKSLVSLDLRLIRGIGERGVNSICDAISAHPTIKMVWVDETDAMKDAMARLKVIIGRLRSERATIMPILCTPYTHPHLATRSDIRRLPKEIMRTISDMLSG